MNAEKMRKPSALAVMDRCAEVMHDEAAPITVDADVAADLRDNGLQLVEARATIAELIEAAEQSLNWLSSYPGYGSRSSHLRVRTALARARGDV